VSGVVRMRPGREVDTYLSESAKRAHVIKDVEMPGSYESKRVPHGLGVKPQGWRVTSIRVSPGTPAEYPNEISRDKNVLVLETVTPETIDLEVW